MAQWPAYRFWLVLACLLASVSVASARDDSARRAVALNWVRLPGAEDCSGGDALSRAVEAKLQREVFPAPRDASVLIEGHVERNAGGYHAQLQMRSSDGALLGSRDLSSQASDCGELSETIAVVLAVMIDPDAAAQAEAGSAPASAAKQAPALPGAGKFAQRISGFGRMVLNLLPDGPLGGLGVAYELALGGWGGLRVEGVLFAPGDTDYNPSGQDQRGHVVMHLGYAGFSYCPLWLTTGRLRSAACAGGELGAVNVWGTGFPGAQYAGDREQWAAGALSARFALRLVGMLELHFGGGVSLPINKVAYAYQTPDVLEPPPVILIDDPVGVLDIGLGARF